MRQLILLSSLLAFFSCRISTNLPSQKSTILAEDKEIMPQQPALETQSEQLATTLKLMSYNIRLDVASDGKNAWRKRKDFLSAQILFLAPDVIGVQEAKPNQIKDLQSALSTYDYIGIGRRGEQKGEHSAIYYNREKISVESEKTFWLSPTPNKVSKGWDAALPRICTYGLFTTLDSDKKFWVFNTHLDHKGTLAQKESLKLILEKIKAINTQNYPVMLMGDFNVAPDSEAFLATKPSLSDAKQMAKITFGPDGTFNGFKYNEPVTRRIDYILLSKSNNLQVDKYAVLSSAVDFKFPSDHFPVFVELKLK